MNNAAAPVLLCALVVLWPAGCATPPRSSPAAAPAREPVSIQSFSRNPFRAVTLPSSRMHRHEEAVKALGSPTEILRQEAPSRHDPAIINSLLTLRYPFGDLVYLHVAGKDIENLILMRLHGNQVPLQSGIRFGQTTRGQIVKLFGAPQEQESNSLSYSVPYTQEITSSTTFFFHDDVLSQVDISSLMMD